VLGYVEYAKIASEIEREDLQRDNDVALSGNNPHAQDEAIVPESIEKPL